MKKLQVLIVEDDKDTAVFFSTVLSLVGFESEIVLSAKEALAWLATSVPDIILLDMRLGLEIGGDDILYQIRTNSRFDNTRVIVITGYPRLAEPISELADLILLKPVEVDQLKDLAKRLGDFEVAPRSMPFRDPVTALFNQDFFFSRLELAMNRTNRRSEFLFAMTIFQHKVDVEVDDRFEPDVIMGILRQIADRLKTYLRPTDTIARLSGWKFATLHEELKHPDDIEVIIKRVQNELSKPFEVEDDSYQLAINYGAVVFHPEYKSPVDMFNAAEKALDQALAFGQAGFYVISTMPRLGFQTKSEKNNMPD
jgi:diguanylate cyclase (GGDEF)-like protein